ncbi:MAG: 2-isopropylmalate synthase [Armatimonadetes bacterium]|nr:2-isopropylmalate synthase [Armatimonadota bacterium]
MTDRVLIFDTTLRDGEQSPGASMDRDQKLTLAKQLARLKVDVIEAGFPISSPGDFNAVREIAQTVRGPIIAGLARAREEDIDAAWRAVQSAERPRIHTFVGTSDIHVKYQLRKTHDEVLQMAVHAVEFAKARCADVEFSPMDATRTDRPYLVEVVAATIAAGATTVNIPDTVGYTTPWEMHDLITHLRENVPGMDAVIISVHCHDDLGLSTANSLAAVHAGARQVECAVNGLGERAGNASLEEIVMGLKTRRGFFGLEVGTETSEIMRTSRMVSSFSGFLVAPNKAIVGDNAFSHESGIHADGVIKERTTFEIMDPQDVGISESAITLGPRSGRAALKKRLDDLGYPVESPEKLDVIYQRFLALADRKKQVHDEDLATLMQLNGAASAGTYSIVSLNVVAGTTTPTAEVTLERDGEEMRGSGVGNGPVEAVCSAIDAATGLSGTLEDFSVHAVTRGRDAIAQARIRLVMEDREAIGRGADVDTMLASAKAYLNGVNKLIVAERKAKIDEV